MSAESCAIHRRSTFRRRCEDIYWLCLAMLRTVLRWAVSYQQLGPAPNRNEASLTCVAGRVNVAFGGAEAEKFRSMSLFH